MPRAAHTDVDGDARTAGGGGVAEHEGGHDGDVDRDHHDRDGGDGDDGESKFTEFDEVITTFVTP